MDDCKDWIVLGQITRPHGVRGAMRVHWYSDPAELVQLPAQVLLRRPAPAQAQVQASVARASSPVALQAQTFTVVDIRSTGQDRALLQVEGISTVEQADPWRGATLSVPSACVPPLAPGEIYLFDLLGREIYDERGIHLGCARHLYDYGAGPVLGILPPPPPAVAATTVVAEAARAVAPSAVGMATEAAAGEQVMLRKARRGRRRRPRERAECLLPLTPGTLRQAEPQQTTAVVAVDPELWAALQPTS